MYPMIKLHNYNTRYSAITFVACELEDMFGIVRVKTLLFHACASTWGSDDP